MEDKAGNSKRPPPDKKLVAWLTRLGALEPLAPYDAVARALASHPQAIEVLYWTFIDPEIPLGRAQMASEICRRVAAAMKKRGL